MTGKTSLRAFQRAVGRCETVCGQMIYWPLSSQLKASWAVGGTGFLAVIREVGFAPCGLMRRVDI